MTVKELTNKYIQEGEDCITAAFWAANPSNPESPNYDPGEIRKIESIKRQINWQ